MATAELEAIAAVAMDVEAYKVAAADLKAYVKLAESHGDMITAVEAEERLRWEIEFVELDEAERYRWIGCGDAAPPQGKQHRLRCRTKKKKKKKKK